MTTSPADFEAVAQPSPFSALNCVGVGGDEFVDGVCFECDGSSGHGHSGEVATGTAEAEPEVPEVGNVKSESEPLGGTPPIHQVEPSAQVQNPELAQPSPEQPLDSAGENPVVPPLARMMADPEDVDQGVVDPQDLWDVIDIRIVLRNSDL